MAKQQIEVKPIKVYKRAGYQVPLKALTEEQVDDAIDRFTYSFYDEKACSKCEYEDQRHCETCDSCPAFGGHRQLAKLVERPGGKQYLSLPYGATAKVRQYLNDLGRPWKAIDKHPEHTPLSRQIKLLPTITLKPFQREAVDTCLKKRKGIIEAPPRAGKTVVGAALVCEIGCKTIIMASQREWLVQFRETFIGSETAMRFTTCKERQIGFCKTIEDFEKTDICLATPQQFMSDKGKKLLAKIKEKFTLLLWDEVHLASATATARVLASFNCTYRIGLSATPTKKQLLAANIFFDLIGPVIYKAKVERLVPRVQLVESGQTFNIGRSGDFTRFVNKIEYNKQRIQLIAKTALRAAEEGHMVLVPVLRIKAVHAIVKAINELSDDDVRPAEFFIGGMKKQVKDKLIGDCRMYKTKILVGNVKLLSTGLNIPRASCLISSSLSNNLPNCEQRTARILTPMEGKPDPLLIYILDDSDIMRRTFRTEWWQCVSPKFKPRMTGPTRAKLLAWLANKDTGGDDSHKSGFEACQM